MTEPKQTTEISTTNPDTNFTQSFNTTVTPTNGTHSSVTQVADTTMTAGKRIFEYNNVRNGLIDEN